MGPKTYMLAVDEILYQKELSPSVETLLLCALRFIPLPLLLTTVVDFFFIYFVLPPFSGRAVATETTIFASLPTFLPSSTPCC